MCLYQAQAGRSQRPGARRKSKKVKRDESTAGVADTCAASYRGYLLNGADRSHPYASPLQSSRLKNLPPALILSTEDDPLRDEAEQYAAKLAAAGVATTLKRLAPAQLQDEGGRNECACRAVAVDEIGRFLAALDTPATLPGDSPSHS